MSLFGWTPPFPCLLHCLHLHGNSSLLGTNVTIPDQNYKYSSWHHFHYSQVNPWSSFTCQRSLMAYLTNIVTLVPNEEEFPTSACWKTGQWRMRGEGQGPAEWRCDLAQGVMVSLLLGTPTPKRGSREILVTMKTLATLDMYAIYDII